MQRCDIAWQDRTPCGAESSRVNEPAGIREATMNWRAVTAGADRGFVGLRSNGFRAREAKKGRATAMWEFPASVTRPKEFEISYRAT
jgi:hypothetical protein